MSEWTDAIECAHPSVLTGNIELRDALSALPGFEAEAGDLFVVQVANESACGQRMDWQDLSALLIDPQAAPAWLDTHESAFFCFRLLEPGRFAFMLGELVGSVVVHEMPMAG